MSLSEPTINFPRGLQETSVPTAQVVPVPSQMRRARDGSVLWWGEADTPGPPPVISPGVAAPVTVAVSPVRPGHAVTVEYRVNGGPVRQAIALPEPRVHDLNARIFRAVLPGQSGGLVEYLPVLRFAGQPISPGLGESAECPRYQVGRGAVETADPSPASSAERAGEPRWDWGTRFLWSATITLRKEVVGELPDGLRINWNVVEGSFAGPSHEGIVLPGAADSMRIRKGRHWHRRRDWSFCRRGGARDSTAPMAASSSLVQPATLAPCAASSIRCLRSWVLRPTQPLTKSWSGSIAPSASPWAGWT